MVLACAAASASSADICPASAAENCCPTDRWVRCAAGLDVLDTLPIRGVRTRAGDETVTTRVVVREIASA